MLEGLDGAEEQYLETATRFIHLEEGTKKCGRGGGFYGVPCRLKYNSLVEDEMSARGRSEYQAIRQSELVPSKIHGGPSPGWLKVVHKDGCCPVPLTREILERG